MTAESPRPAGQGVAVVTLTLWVPMAMATQAGPCSARGRRGNSLRQVSRFLAVTLASSTASLSLPGCDSAPLGRPED